jgi:hypothetical protein
MREHVPAIPIRAKLVEFNYHFTGETDMRAIGLLFLLVTLSNVAIAQTSECESISKANDRQACRDKATPAWVGQHAKRPGSRISAPPDQAASGSSPPNQTPLADVLAVENSKLDAKIKGICRGC